MSKTREEVESSNEGITEFLTNKSHEIRTLMTRIMGMTDLMLMTELTEEQLNYITIVKSSSGLLLSVFNDMQDYSKLHAAKVNLEQVPFDIRATIHEVVDLFHVAARQKNIFINLNNIDDEIPEYLIGDPLKLKQVLTKLVGNGVKFTNLGEVTLRVDLEELDESSMHLRFRVSDTGIGIPEERRVKLFKDFFDPEDSNPRKFKSSGLAQVKKLVELMDGVLQVMSTEGLGSQFSFTVKFGVQAKNLE